MENNELLRRVEDLRARCEKNCEITATGFLSPAEQYMLEHRFKSGADVRLVFHGGAPYCERKMAFFLPFYEDPALFEPTEYIKGIRLSCPFGAPEHRDYMGAILGMGVGREWVGDIMVRDGEAYLFCRTSIERHLLSVEKVGRFAVKAAAVALDEIPVPERRVSQESFSVMSLRLDAVVGGMFHLSRTEAQKRIEAGAVTLNYEECLKTDAPIREGDVISLRGAGKGSVTGTGGTSRKGRLFVYAELLR